MLPYRPFGSLPDSLFDIIFKTTGVNVHVDSQSPARSEKGSRLSHANPGSLKRRVYSTAAIRAAKARRTFDWRNVRNTSQKAWHRSSYLYGQYDGPATCF